MTTKTIKCQYRLNKYLMKEQSCWREMCELSPKIWEYIKICYLNFVEVFAPKTVLSHKQDNYKRQYKSQYLQNNNFMNEPSCSMGLCKLPANNAILYNLPPFVSCCCPLGRHKAQLGTCVPPIPAFYMYITHLRKSRLLSSGNGSQVFWSQVKVMKCVAEPDYM